MEPAISTIAPDGTLLEAKPKPTARVAVLIVTWNRRDLVEGVLEAVGRQSFPRTSMDVVVIDNASTDGTLETLSRRFRPDVIVDNPTPEAHRPAFRPRPVGEAIGNTLGFGSLAIVRNGENLGGCGGFNTGLAYVEQSLAVDRGRGLIEPSDGQTGDRADGRPEFVWLVDDDADLPPEALDRLVAAMRTDPKIGLVGSRTVDLRDRRTTIESTIYQERSSGVFADQPDGDHPRRADHEAWVARVGGVKGRREFSGLRDVDIVSACSMLARWSAVERVGFWDHRYFIYCDDADWCLRFARAGWRVVLNLDAVVFHTPWHHKLTPSRLYYAQRNLLWTIRKSFEPSRLRRVMGVRVRALLRQSLHAGVCHRIPHAEVLRRALEDAMSERSGKVNLDGPKAVGLDEVAAIVGGSRGTSGRSAAPLMVASVVHRPIAVEWAAGVRGALQAALGPARRLRWIELVRNDVPGSHSLRPVDRVERIVYAAHWKSKLRRQLGLLRHRLDLLVIFDGTCDLGLVRAPRWILHVDSAKPDEGVLERGGTRPRLAFLGRWGGTAYRSRGWVRRIRPGGPTGKFGGSGSLG